MFTLLDWFNKLQVEHDFIKKLHDYYEKVLVEFDSGKYIETLKNMEIWKKVKTSISKRYGSTVH